jgi:protein-S-isoprenylcysteine O-methyltransferase Ste14
MSQHTRRRAGVAATVFCVVGAALAGFASVSDLPTLGGVRSSSESSLVITAKQFYDCLNDAGLPVQLFANGQGELTLVQINASETAMWRYADGSGGAMSQASDPNGPQQQVINDFVDGVDHSDEWKQCLADSGYDEQAAQGPAVMDPAQLQLQVKSNNRWVACARDNGWPDVKDSVMPAKTDGSDWPSVMLPPTITEDQLRQLVAACATFDKDQADRMRTWAGNGQPPDYLLDPFVSFDVPGMNGAGRPNPGRPARVMALICVLFIGGWVMTHGANLQKYFFKISPHRQFLWITPETLSDGDHSLFVNAYWGASRHINYLGEIIQALAVALVVGYPGVLTVWLYPLYYIGLLVSRQSDDDKICRAKYGDLWGEYTQKVKYKIIPHVY